MVDLLAASLKSTIDKADAYALTMLASSVVFAVLCFPEAQKGRDGAEVEWQLLGFPLMFQPALALAILYCLFIVSSLLTDNMLLHLRDLAQRINDARSVSDLLMHPSVLTVSPIGQFLTTAFPSLLLLLGLWRLWSRGEYVLPPFAWFLLAAFSCVGVIVYLRVFQTIHRFQLPLSVGGT